MTEPSRMGPLNEVALENKSLTRFVELVGLSVIEDLERVALRLGQRLQRRVVWNVNSTAAGGGVAEMLHSLLAYARGLGIDTRWAVTDGTPEFFRITKRLHNALHGDRGDGSSLDVDASEIYRRVTADNARRFAAQIGPGDIVLLHDPQTAGLIPQLVAGGAHVVWRCHIGSDARSAEADRAWAFLEPYLRQAHVYVFSRQAYVPEMCDHGKSVIVPPTIDPFSPKNQHLEPDVVRSILVEIGLLDGAATAEPTFVREDGTVAPVRRQAEVLRDGPARPFGRAQIVQVSRWDRLKDPIGVLRGFSLLPSTSDADLMLVGPSVTAVADDPEGAEVFREVAHCWRALPPETRGRIQLVNLPMDDLQENAAMVNAIQRHASIIVQKSLREGFGLTVTEAMWKGVPLVASRVGGIQDQVEDGVSGLLLEDPRDLDGFAAALDRLLGDPEWARELGQAAREQVTRRYLGTRSLVDYARLIEHLDRVAPPTP